MKKLGGWIVTALLWAWFALPKIMDWIGRTTFADDAGDLMRNKIPVLFDLLTQTPWWIPAALAILLTAWMIFITVPESWWRTSETSEAALPTFPKERKWAAKRSRLRIWEAGCYLAAVPPSEYSKSDEAQSIANELIYYASQGYINLAGETDHVRNLRIMKQGRSAAVDEQNYISIDTVKHIEDTDHLSTWLPIVDEINRENRG